MYNHTSFLFIISIKECMLRIFGAANNKIPTYHNLINYRRNYHFYITRSRSRERM